ncbi:MAG: YcaO-like family protein [bacterium]|nr:YcaO-like family protein [bacterium]
MPAPNAKEQKQTLSTFSPFPLNVLRQRKKLIEEALKPCSRFRSSLSWDELVDFKMAGLLDRLDFLGRDALVPTEGVPLNWRILLNYLHSHGVTDSKHFSFIPSRTDMPKTFSVRLSPRSDASDTDGRSVGRHGFGSTSSPEESLSRAIGEILERYFLTIYRRADLYCASYVGIIQRKKTALNIFKLNNFLPWQKEMFPVFVRTDDRSVMWVRGRELLADIEVFMPAQLAYWNYKFLDGEMALAQPTTNGGAGHFTREEAILSSLLENIQRDGFLIYWLNSLSPKIIDPSTIVDKEIKQFLKYLRRYELEYYFLNTTTDIGVPSCACVLVDHRGGEPIIAVGGSAGFSFKELVFQSAGEALAVYNMVASSERYVLPESYIPFTDPTIGRDQRLCLWKGTEMYKRFKFFISGTRQSFEGFMGDATWHNTPSAQIAYILRKLRELGDGYEVYCYEANHKVLKTLGYHVVKTIVPRLMHLYLNENRATLDAPRLHDVPVRLGHRPAEIFNPWPHPFP